MTRNGQDAAALGGRILLAGLLLLGALQKTLDPQPEYELLHGLGLPGWLVWPALLFNIVAGLALILGVVTRPFALMAAAYCAVTSVFHYIPADPWQMTIFVKNWSIAGGFLMLAAHGPGRYALTRY